MTKPKPESWSWWRRGATALAVASIFLLTGCYTWSALEPPQPSEPGWNPPQLGIEADGICVKEPTVCEVW